MNTHPTTPGQEPRDSAAPLGDQPGQDAQLAQEQAAEQGPSTGDAAGQVSADQAPTVQLPTDQAFTSPAIDPTAVLGGAAAAGPAAPAAPTGAASFADPAPAPAPAPTPTAATAAEPQSALQQRFTAPGQPGPAASPQRRKSMPRTGPIVWGALILAFCGYVAQRTFGGGGSLDTAAWITATVIGLGVLLLGVGTAVLIRNSRNNRNSPGAP